MRYFSLKIIKRYCAVRKQIGYGDEITNSRYMESSKLLNTVQKILGEYILGLFPLKE